MQGHRAGGLISDVGRVSFILSLAPKSSESFANIYLGVLSRSKLLVWFELHFNKVPIYVVLVVILGCLCG